MPRKPAPQKQPLKKPSGRPPLTPHLESCVVAAKDLRDQPESEFVLIVGASAERKPNYYAVDNYRGDAGIIQFVNRFGDIVFAARPDSQWSLVSRDAVNIVTERELITFAKDDVTARNAFYKELDPAAYAVAEAEVMSPKSIGIPLSALLGGVGGHEHAAPREPDDKPTPGQYL